MQIRYSAEPFQEMEFLGTREDYLILADLLDQEEGTFIPRNGVKSDPYHAFVREVVIKPGPGEMVAITLNRLDGQLVIRGGKKGLALLEKNIRAFGVEAKNESHQHFEYFEGHFYFAKESFPFVCRLHEPST